MNKINQLLKDVLENIKPSKEEIKFIDKTLEDFLKKFNSNLNKLKIKAEIFVGGSFAKKTVIKKDKYDVDVFVRFDKKYKNDEISHLTERVLNKFVKELNRIHGSRDYFYVQVGPKFFIEIIPVIKVDKPKDALNITDLSYSHVKYVNKKLKGEILDEVLLAKAFCFFPFINRK